MNISNYLNVQRVLRTIATEWGCSVRKVKRTVQRVIDQSWEKAAYDAEAKALLDKYFPSGKPTTEQYILRLGLAHENGENVPYLLND